MGRGRITKEEQAYRIRMLLRFIFIFRYATREQLISFAQERLKLSYQRWLIEYSLKQGFISAYHEPHLNLKVYHLTKRGKGLSRSKKLFFQILIGLFLGILIVINKNLSTTWDFPFFKHVVADLGVFYIFWTALVVIATSNAVNFTDGLDGLAIGAIIINSLIFAILAYLSGHIKFAQYLFIPYIQGAGELAVLCFALVGAGLGFLWFNAHPAEVFMGDVGALSLGGLIGAIALFIKKEFLLVISGGLFVVEALTVILQILSVRLRGKRMFKAAPLHHNLQLLGWKESKIIVRLWIICIMCAVLSFLTLKLR